MAGQGPLGGGIAGLVLYNARRFTETRLASGMRVLVKEVDSIPGVNCSLWYPAGGRHSPPGRSGIAHFLEHMVFKGTRRYPKGEVDRICDRHGGSNNAYTELDYTYYVFNFARDRWEIALDMLASMMGECLFPPEEFEAERQVVIQERMTSEDCPGFRLEEAALLACLPDSPYRFGVIGLLDDLRRVTREEMIAFYRLHYRPQEALLVITGDVETDAALRAVEERFKGVDPGPDDGPADRDAGESGQAPATAATVPQAAPHQAEIRLRLDLPAQLPELRIQFPAPEVGHPDSYPLLMLNNVMSYGKSSRLYRRLIEREQLATEAYFSFQPCHLPFLVEISAQARPEVPLADVEQALFQEIGRLQEERLTAGEIDKARRQVRNHLLLANQALEDQSYLLGKAAMVRDVDYLDEFFDRLGEVDAERIRDAAQRLFRPEQRTVAALHPLPDGAEPGDVEPEEAGE